MNWLMPSGPRLLNMSASCEWKEGGREERRQWGRAEEMKIGTEGGKERGRGEVVATSRGYWRVSPQ